MVIGLLLVALALIPDRALSDPRIIGPLVAWTGETDAWDRSARLEILAQFPGPVTTSALVAGLNDPDPSVRGAAPEGLRDRTDPAVRQALLRLASSPVDKDRIAAHRALPTCGCEDLAVVPAQMRALDDPSEAVAKAAAAGLVKCWAQARPVVLLRLASAAAPLCGRLLAVLSRAGAPEAEPQALAAITSRDLGLRHAARAAITRLARHDRAAAARFLSHRLPDVRQAAMNEAHAHLGDPAIAARIVASTGDPRPEIREAALALLKGGDEAVTLPLRSRLDLERLRRDPAAGVRRIVVGWMADKPLGREQTLVRALSDPDPGVRQGALEGLGSLEQRRLPDGFARVLGDREPQVRLAALKLIEQAGDRRFDAAILPLVSDGDLAVSHRAARLMGSSRTLGAFEAILRRLETGPERSGSISKEEHRCTCGGPEQPTGTLLSALTSLDPGRAEPHLIRYLADRRLPGRETAAQMLGRCRSERARQALVASLGDPGWTIREAAATALGDLADRRAIPALERSSWKDPAANVRIEASLALARFGEARHVWNLLEALRSMEWLQGPPGRGPQGSTLSAIEEALSRRCGPGEMAVLSGWEKHPLLAELAVLHLESCGPGAIPLISRLSGASRRNVQLAALRSLASLGETGLKLVLEALRDPDPIRRALALAALRKAPANVRDEHLAAALRSVEPYERLQALRLILKRARRPGGAPGPAILEVLRRLESDPMKGIREAARAATGKPRPASRPAPRAPERR
jgi:HEAT repeat protein